MFRYLQAWFETFKVVYLMYSHRYIVTKSPSQRSVEPIVLRTPVSFAMFLHQLNIGRDPTRLLGILMWDHRTLHVCSR